MFVITVVVFIVYYAVFLPLLAIGENQRKVELEQELLYVVNDGVHEDNNNCPQRRTSVLVLDLDETLVHTEFFATVNHPSDPKFKVHERPYVHEFLRHVAGMFDELAVFTAGTRSYAEPIIDKLSKDANVQIVKRLYRDACTPILQDAGAGAGGGAGEGGPVTMTYAKDMILLGYPLKNVTLLDNMPYSYSLQPHCGVPIRSFFGTQSEIRDDRALLDVVPLLAVRAAVDYRENEEINVTP